MQYPGLTLTLMTAIVTAYIAFRHQQRLKAFELFYARRNEVIGDIEKMMNRIYEARTKGPDDYRARFRWDSLTLYHKILGANFGEPSVVLAKTYFTILQEPTLDESVLRGPSWSSWIDRTLNVLSLIHGLAHANLSREIESYTKSYSHEIFRHLCVATDAAMLTEKPLVRGGNA